VHEQRIDYNYGTRQSGEQGISIYLQIVYEAFERIGRDGQGINGEKGLIKHALSRHGIEALDHLSAAIATGQTNTLGRGIAGRN